MVDVQRIADISARIGEINQIMTLAKNTKDKSGVSLLTYDAYQTLLVERRSLRAELKDWAEKMVAAAESPANTEAMNAEESLAENEEYEEY